MRIIHLTLAGFAALAACKQPAPTPPGAPPSPAAAHAATPPPAADPYAGAEAFVRNIYAGYLADEPDESRLNRVAPPMWSARMQALMDRDVALAGEHLPFLDADPICNCQDHGDITVREVRLAPAPGGAVDAAVRFVNFETEETTVLRLIREGGGWRIDDIVNDEGEPTLAAALAESNRRIEAGGKALYRE